MADLNSTLKRCCTCKQYLSRDCFGPAKKKDGLRPRCRECHRKGNAESRARNLEASRKASLRWQKNNPEKAKAKRERWKAANPGVETINARKWRERNPERLAETSARRRGRPEIRVMKSISQRIRALLVGKEGKSTRTLVGYTGDELKAHLERQFLRGMSWDNYGDWHVDHILPLSSFPIKSIHDPEIKRAWALTNLRPIWAKDNRQKKDKILFLI